MAVDLRLRLLKVLLSGVGLVLVLAAGVVIVASLREDVAEEMAASAQLVELMLSISEAREAGQGRLEALLADDRLRHIRVALERPGAAPPAAAGLADGPGSLAQRLVGGPQAVPEARRIALGNGHALLIQADPASEVEEILQDAARMLVLLAVFVLGTVVAVWRATDRALRPVRALEEGLARLARGDMQARLPRFELKEFRRIAAAIDDLAEALARARANERRLGRCLMGVQEAERAELARELHDEFGQTLTAIGAAAVFVEQHAGAADTALVAECARDIRQQSSRMSLEVRSLLRRLRPHGLEGLGMRDALGELIDAWRQRAPAIALSVELPCRLPPLAAEAGLALYRTVQEALTNIVRHAGASRVRVELAVAANALVLRIGDDGGGRAEAVQGLARGGLLGMRERAEMAGGVLQLGASPLGGLGITLTLPIDNNKGDTNDAADPAAR